MSERHRFDPILQVCLGCGVAASTAVDLPAPNCPAYYREIQTRGTTFTVMIRPEDEELFLIREDGVRLLGLAAEAMFELRDAIFEGVRKIREAKGQ